MFRIKRINKEEVAPVKFVDVKPDPRPIKGRDIFPEIYANIFFCARKKSGKSSAIFHTIKNCATIETRVIAFVSTLHRDPTWRAIQKLCDDMKVDFTGYTSIKDPETKEDILESIVKMLEQTTGEETDEKDKPPERLIVLDTDVEPSGRKPKKPKELAPRFIFIFDDLSGELQTPSFTAFLKKNRQFKAKTIIASQYWNDIALQARKQLDYVLLYQGLGQSLDKLQEIFKNCDLNITFEVFLELYRFCTAERYHFMYIDVVNCEFRRDFSHRIELPKDEENEEPERDL